MEVDQLIEKSTGKLYLPHTHRAAREMKPNQGYLEFPPSLDEPELATLLTSYKTSKDPQTLSAIYSGIQSRTYALINRHFGHIAPYNLDDVVQEIIGIALPGFIQEYVATSTDQIPFDLFLAHKVITTGKIVLKANTQNTLSLEEPFSNDNPFALQDRLIDPLLVEDMVKDPYDVMREAIEWSVTNGIIITREKVVLELKLGLNGNKEHSRKEIGDRFGVSEERIRQIEVGALRKLRNSRRFREEINSD